MSKKALVLVMLLALAALMGTLWLGMQLGARQAATSDPLLDGTRNQPAQPSLPSLTARAVPAAASDVPFSPLAAPPWGESSASEHAALPGLNRSASPAERQKQVAELKAMQQALMKSIQETHRADPRLVDALLLKIKEVTGASVVGGVNLDTLRSNLARTEEMQRIALDMNREVTQPGGGDPKRIKAYVDQLQAVQRQSNAASATPSGLPVEPAK